jgi:hypothetical protein
MNATSYKIVNNSRCDISPFDRVFLAAYDSRCLPEELSDLFTIRFLSGINEDGTDRMIVEMA